MNLARQGVEREPLQKVMTIEKIGLDLTLRHIDGRSEMC